MTLEAFKQISPQEVILQLRCPSQTGCHLLGKKKHKTKQLRLRTVRFDNLPSTYLCGCSHTLTDNGKENKLALVTAKETIKGAKTHGHTKDRT